jgi:hypothetical protein
MAGQLNGGGGKGETENEEHTTGTGEEWRAARLEVLEVENELTRRSDELAQKRHELPWVPIEKEYVFETDDGKKSLWRAESRSAPRRKRAVAGARRPREVRRSPAAF